VVPSALKSDIHEGASVKTGARRDRDFPDIHSASPAAAGRHETFCGCSHSHQRRRTAPCRTSGCNLSPALDLDSEALLQRLRCAGPCGPLRATRRAAPWAMTRMPAPAYRGVGRAGRIGPKPAMPSPQDWGPQAPPGPPDACPPRAGLTRTLYLQVTRLTEAPYIVSRRRRFFIGVAAGTVLLKEASRTGRACFDLGCSKLDDSHAMIAI